MWLFTKHGFYSAVCARQGDGSWTEPVDPDRVMVRARVGSHLENLIKHFPQWLGDVELLDSRDTDYRYRILVEKNTWQKIVSELVSEMDYDNFKSSVGKNVTEVEPNYKHALYDVWHTMHQLQTGESGKS